MDDGKFIFKVDGTHKNINFSIDNKVLLIVDNHQTHVSLVNFFSAWKRNNNLRSGQLILWHLMILILMVSCMKNESLQMRIRKNLLQKYKCSDSRVDSRMSEVTNSLNISLT